MWGELTFVKQFQKLQFFSFGDHPLRYFSFPVILFFCKNVYDSLSPLSELPKQLLACIDTLGVLCRASPALVAPHVETLLPYLKGENGLSDADEASVCRQVHQTVNKTILRSKKLSLRERIVGVS